MEPDNGRIRTIATTATKDRYYRTLTKRAGGVAKSADRGEDGDQLQQMEGDHRDQVAYSAKIGNTDILALITPRLSDLNEVSR